MAPKVSEAHTKQRREQIIMAAMQCFATNGFHKTTMQDICKKSDLSPGAVYSYFASKDEIIQALCQMGDQMNNQLFEFSHQHEFASPQAALAHSIGLFISQYKHPMMQLGARMDAMFLAEALTDETLASMGNESYTKLMNQIIALMENSQRENEIDPTINTRALSQVLFSLVQGLAAQLLMSGDEEIDVDAYQEAVTKLVTQDIFVTPKK